MKRYVVNTPINHDGEPLPIGARHAFSDAHAAPLLARGAITLDVEPPAEPTAAPPADPPATKKKK